MQAEKERFLKTKCEFPENICIYIQKYSHTIVLCRQIVTVDDCSYVKAFTWHDLNSVSDADYFSSWLSRGNCTLRHVMTHWRQFCLSIHVHNDVRNCRKSNETNQMLNANAHIDGNIWLLFILPNNPTDMDSMWITFIIISFSEWISSHKP